MRLNVQLGVEFYGGKGNFDEAGICCTLSEKHWGTRWICMSVMHANTHTQGVNTHTLISQHMVH